MLALQVEILETAVVAGVKAKLLTGYDMINLLTSMKRNAATSWLCDADSTSLQQTCLHLERAFRDHFNKTLRRGFPVFKLKVTARKAFTARNTINPVSTLQVRNGYVRVPKHGWVRCRGLRDEFLSAKLKRIAVFEEAGKFYASILADIDMSIKNHKFCETACGIDTGLRAPLVIACDGAALYSKRLANSQSKLQRRDMYLKRMQRHLERQGVSTAESNRRKKTKQRITKHHKTSTDILKDAQHKVSHAIAKTYSVVVVEDLSIKNMTASMSGTVEKPGKGVRRKSNMNREMLRMAPSRTLQFIEYKVKRYGGTFCKVNPRNTSITCSHCGVIDKRSRENQAIFHCISCDFTLHADVNAARNILRRGLKILTQNLEKELEQLFELKSTVRNTVTVRKRTKAQGSLTRAGRTENAKHRNVVCDSGQLTKSFKSPNRRT